MSTKKLQKTVVTNNQVKNDELLAMMGAGEKLGIELMERLAKHGCSPQALIVETYALAMAYASLKAIAHSEGFEPEILFEFLEPTFKEEMEEYVREAEQRA
jgi:hypothetical protein